MPEEEQEEDLGYNPRYVRSRDEQELKERAIFGDQTTAIYDEMNSASASGFLDREELGVIRRFQSLMSKLRFVEDEIGVEFTRIKDMLLQQLMYMAHSSKSKGGAGVKAAISQIMIQQQDISQSYSEQQEEKKSMLDKLRSVGGRLQDKGSGFGSDVEFMSHGRKKPWED